MTIVLNLIFAAYATYFIVLATDVGIAFFFVPRKQMRDIRDLKR
jgi:hypothetical protein